MNNTTGYLAEDIEELVLPPEGHCFHCAEPVPNPPFYAEVLGESRLMCCMGCQLAAESIVEAGLEQYYLDRTEINRTASLPTELDRLKAYDHDDIKSQFVYDSQGKSVAEMSVNNLRCAACTWLIESRLYELEGVDKCQVNLTNQRMRVVWDEDKLPISEILLTVNQIGYDAKPYRQDTHEAMLERQNKKMMIRLGIAALGAMQAMMFAVGMYFGNYSAFGGMLIEQRDFLRWVSLFVSIPVFFYCAVPFFRSAWIAVKIRQVNMDVPVSIALIVTFFASLYATVTGSGETYYDSVSMFVFFLLAGRYIEHNARLKAANMANDLVVLEPTLVEKIGSVPEFVAELKASKITYDNQDADSSTESHDADNPQGHKPSTTNKTIDETIDHTIDDTLNSSENGNINFTDISTTTDSDFNYSETQLQQLFEYGELIHLVQTNKQSNKQHPTKKVQENNLEDAVSNHQHLTDKHSITASDIESNYNNDLQQVTSQNAVIESQSVTANSLKIGDIIMIEAGSEIVADGILCSETATVSQGLLTGESLLIVKHRGDKVIGGSQNDSQPFIMIVTELPENSQIALIDRLMNRAMSEKPKVAELADKWARWFVARILVLSVVVFIGWYFIDPTQAIWATVAVLVATCPCALSLATPIALTVSTNRLASYGFLTTRGHTIQTLAEITHVAFDKTGTLTYGKPNLLYIEDFASEHHIANSNASKTSFKQLSNRQEGVNEITHGDSEPSKYDIDSIALKTEYLNASSIDKQTNNQGEIRGLNSESNKDNLLAIAAALEVGSRHPIASALLDAAYQLHLPEVSDLQHHTAGGVEAVVKGIGADYRYRLGHLNFAMNQQSNSEMLSTEEGVDSSYQLDLKTHKASSAVMLTRYETDNNQQYNSEQNSDIKNTNHDITGQGTWVPIALFYFNDKVREGVGKMIHQLQNQNIQTLILTGDPSTHAQVVAEELGVDEVYDGLSPSDKVNHIKSLQQQNNVVMMVGDGINDAPVLAAANISTAVAGAADLAQVSSDSVILNGKLQSVFDAKRIADKAQKIIAQNIRWAIGYNSVVLIPAAFGYVPPWLAAIGMSFSSLVVVLNALRLKRA